MQSSNHCVKPIDMQNPHTLSSIRELLIDCSLPVDDLHAPADRYWVGVEKDRVLIGCGAVEIHASAGLLRSVALQQRWRGSGVGRMIVSSLEAAASDQHMTGLYLLTETAETFFQRLHYRVVERESVPAAIAGSQQFAGICPASAVAMHKVLVTGTR